MGGEIEHSGRCCRRSARRSSLIRSSRGSCSRSIAGGWRDEAQRPPARRSPRAPGRDLHAAARCCSAPPRSGSPALLAGRMGYIAIAENERYSGLAESNRVQMRLIPPRRGWIVDRHGQPMAINRSDFRVDLIPDQLEDPERVIADARPHPRRCRPRRSQRIRTELDARRRLPAGAGRRASERSRNMPRSRCALPELPGVSPLRSFSRFYPEGAAVGHLVGYVGTPNREEYERENRNPLLITPGFKIGKEGLEKVMEQRPARPPRRGAGRGHGARPAGPRAAAPCPTSAGRRCARRSTPACRASRRAGSARNRARCVVLDCRQRRHPLHGLDAGLRSQQLLRRHQPHRMEDAGARTSAIR